MYRVLVAMVVLLGVAGVASATSVLRLDTAELSARAEVIVHGRVVHTEARVAGDGGIVTDVRVEVSAFLKGGEGRTFDFTVYGGVVGARGSAISGAPVFEAGEEMLVFLDAPNRAGSRMTIGLSQGKYSIREEDGRKVAYRNLEGLRLVDPVTGEVEEAGAEQGVDFAELLAAVRRHLAGE